MKSRRGQCCVMASLLVLMVGCYKSHRLPSDIHHDGAVHGDSGRRDGGGRDASIRHDASRDGGMDGSADATTRPDARGDGGMCTDAAFDPVAFDAGGGTGGPFGGSGSAGPTVLDIAQRLASAECHDYLRCIPIEQKHWHSEASCVREMTYLHRHVDVPSWAAVDAAGELDFDEAAFEGCLRHIRAAGCSQRNFRHYDECRRAFRGHAAVGEPCGSEFVCEPGASCAINARSSCVGVCIAQAAAGEACHGTLPTNYLAPYSCANESHCEEGVCVPPRREGEPCHAGLTIDRECADGLSCDPGAGSTERMGLCVPIQSSRSAPLDSMCDPQLGPYCAPDLVCTLWMPEGLAGTALQQCRPPAERSARCYPASPSSCPADQYCRGISLVGICSDFPQLGQCCSGYECLDGTSCIHSDPSGRTTCGYPGAAGAFCDETSGTIGAFTCLANGGCVEGRCAEIQCAASWGGNEFGVSVTGSWLVGASRR